MQKIIKNMAKCKKCGETIESKHRHDFVWCKCESIAVDGGKDYLKRVGDIENIIELSEMTEETKKVIGIFGGAGSGKTSIIEDLCKLRKNYLHINVDKVAKGLYNKKDKPVYKELVKKFGKKIITKSDEISKEELSKLVYNKKTVGKVNDIIIPALKEELKSIINNSENDVIILDAALVKKFKLTNFDIYIHADYNTRVYRIAKRFAMNGIKKTIDECENIADAFSVSSNEIVKNTRIVDNGFGMNLSDSVFSVMKIINSEIYK